MHPLIVTTWIYNLVGYHQKKKKVEYGSVNFPKAKPPKQSPQVIMRREMWWETSMKPLCERGTWASCSLDQLQQGYLTPSPAHRWTHHIDGERMYQSNTTPQETRAFRPLGKTLETVSKCNKTSTNEPLVRAHFELRRKIYRLPADTNAFPSHV